MSSGVSNIRYPNYFENEQVLVFPLGKLGTFARFELPTFFRGKFDKNESNLLEML